MLLVPHPYLLHTNSHSEQPQQTLRTAAMNLDSHAAPQPKKSMWKGFQEMSGVHHPFVIKKLTVKVGESIKGSGKDDKGKYEIKGKVQHDHTL